MIQLENVGFSYGGGQILNNISMTLEGGKIYALIGRTGSGKSTLIRHLNGLLLPQSGRVLVDGEDTKKADMRHIRRKVGIVFQYPEQQLFAESVYEDIAFGPKNLGLDDDEIHKRVEKAMREVSLSSELCERSPFSLSGGEKRRAALAGVLAMEPQTLVLDEPSAGLDPGSARELYSILHRIHSEQIGSTIFFVSHSMSEAAMLADVIFVLDGGEIVLSGSADEVFSQTDALKSAGLGLPQSAELMLELRSRGFKTEAAFSPEAAAREILQLIQKNLY